VNIKDPRFLTIDVLLCDPESTEIATGENARPLPDRAIYEAVAETEVLQVAYALVTRDTDNSSCGLLSRKAAGNLRPNNLLPKGSRQTPVKILVRR
jgi:hypothetical protein